MKIFSLTCACCGKRFESVSCRAKYCAECRKTAGKIPQHVSFGTGSGSARAKLSENPNS